MWMARARPTSRLRRQVYCAVLVAVVAAQPMTSRSALRAQAVTNRFAPAREARREVADARGPAALQRSNATVQAKSDGWKTTRITAYTLGAVVVGVLVFALIAIRAD